MTGVQTCALPIYPKHSECELLLDKSLNKKHIKHGYVIPRIAFDNFMLEEAKKVSKYEDGFTVNDLIFDNNNIVVGVKGRTKNGEEKEFRGNLVFGADGPSSIVSKKAGVNLELEIEIVG